jgi:hypothetical protein
MDEPLERIKPNTGASVLDLSERITRKALDVLDKRIASREISDNMLLRIVVSLSESTAALVVSLSESTAALRDEALIKQFEAATYADRIRQKTLDVLHKRMTSREISDNMLLRIVVSLSKSTADLI